MTPIWIYRQSAAEKIKYFQNRLDVQKHNLAKNTTPPQNAENEVDTPQILSDAYKRVCKRKFKPALPRKKRGE